MTQSCRHSRTNKSHNSFLKCCSIKAPNSPASLCLQAFAGEDSQTNDFIGRVRQGVIFGRAQRFSGKRVCRNYRLSNGARLGDGPARPSYVNVAFQPQEIELPAQPALPVPVTRLGASLFVFLCFWRKCRCALFSKPLRKH